MIDNDFKQISQDFFSEVQNLRMIEEPFSLNDIAEQKRIRDLQNQFELIRAVTQTKKHKMRLRPNTVLQIKKNRYPQQSIYEHSRIILTDTQNGGKNQNGYINANIVPDFYNSPEEGYSLILTQGPIQNTVDDFKKMIEQQKVQCVVMLCRLVENGKNRCSDYLLGCQSQDKDRSCPYITVKTVNLGENFDNYQYEHVYYSQWPDKKVPSQLSHIIELMKVIQKYKRIAIHCSAGLGRSGVIAALLLVLRSCPFQSERKLSIFQAVRKLREYRFGAVQNSEQYAFLYEFFQDYQESNS